MKDEQKTGEITIRQSCIDVSTKIEERIFTVRGKQVMIDKDLAFLYGVETKLLNRVVKRNIERFPDDFMFRLTKEECLRCQIGTLNHAQGQHLKYLPYAFTENGIAMLSSVLRSETAIAVNIKIMRTFTQIRKSIYRAYMPNAVSAEHTVIVLANHTCQAYRQPRNRGLAKK